MLKERVHNIPSEKEYKAVLEDIISQEGNCVGIVCLSCPFFSRTDLCFEEEILIEAKHILLEKYIIPDILENE